MVGRGRKAEAQPGAGEATGGRACSLEAPGRFSLVAQRPQEPGPHLARVRIVKTGICGTDLSIWRGDYAVPLPLVLGHEWVGTVEAVGSEVDTTLVGQRVVGEINYTCRSRFAVDPCAACRRGLESHCFARTVMGIVHASGSWATWAIVPAVNLHEVPIGVLDDHAVFVEPLAAAIQTFELAPIYPGDRVVVLGAGRLGSLVIQVARLKGSRVIAVDPGPEARRRAKKLGAHEVMAPGSKLADDVRDATGGLGADVVVEASGSAVGLSAAVDLVRPRGTIALKTTCGQPSRVEATRLVVNEIQVSTSRCGPFGKALALMRDGRLKINPLIAAEYPLSSIDEAVRAAEGAGKILLRPD